MGAGHDGAARELVRRLQAQGTDAEMRDFLTSAPLRIGSLLKSSYAFQMRYLAWTYDLTYRLLFRVPVLCPPIGRAMTRLTGHHLLAWIAEYEPDVVVSTYPMTSIVLGQLRRHGQLELPTINFITDFGVHPLWTHPGIDLNLAVHARPAALAEIHSGRPSIATGPMVSPRFADVQDRLATRTMLGLASDDRAVLIVSGSWGVGDVTNTYRAIAASGQYVPVVVCGHDERLRARLARLPGGRVVGWTNDMPALMAAADALVENAGGLTAMEALSVGLPIISFRPIAGHGKENTTEMQAAGVSRVAQTAKQLLFLLDELTTPGPARQASVDTGKAMFALDPTRIVTYAARVGAAQLNDTEALAALAAEADDLDIEMDVDVDFDIEFDPAAELALLSAAASDANPADDDEDDDNDGELAPVVPIGTRWHGGPVKGDDDEDEEEVALEPTGTDGAAASDRSRPRRPSVRVARFAALLAAFPLIWAALTTGVGVATAYGAGVAHARSDPAHVAYLGVRLAEPELSDPVIAQQLAALHATAVIDEETAASDPVGVQHLVSLGVNVENGGAGPRFNDDGHRILQSPWTRATGDVDASQFLAAITGEPVKVFVPGRRLNAFDLGACYDAHSVPVVPNEILSPSHDDPLGNLVARHTYLVNGKDATPAQVQELLNQLSAQLAVAKLSGAPLSDLA